MTERIGPHGANRVSRTKLSTKHVEAVRRLCVERSREAAARALKASPFTIDKILTGGELTAAGAARIASAIDGLASP